MIQPTLEQYRVAARRLCRAPSADLFVHDWAPVAPLHTEGAYVDVMIFVPRDEALRQEPVAEQSTVLVVSRDDVKDVYAEGVATGIAIGRKLGPAPEPEPL